MKRKNQNQQQQNQQEQLTQITKGLLVDMSIISQTNRRIQQKCPNIHIQLELQDTNNLLLKLYKDKRSVSIIKMNVSNTITISSDTYGTENRNKKYNSILRSVLILLALSMQYKSKPIQYIYSDAVNWKTVKTLNQRKFVPIQIFMKEPPYFYSINQQVFKVLENVQTLKTMLSGDEHDERKPWIYVRMELDLQMEQNKILQSTKTSLTNSISKMSC